MTLILGVMISGRGSNLGAILQEISKSRCPASVALVVSNIPGAPGLKIAEKYGVRHIVLEPSDFETRRAHEKQLARIFRSLKVELLVLAGYMRLVGSALLEEYPNKIINIHPSLLPDFKGLDAQRQALAAGVSEAGCTVHVVTEELDDGPILAQSRVPVLPNDSVKSLSDRILKKEHQLLPEVITKIALGEIQLTKG